MHGQGVHEWKDGRVYEGAFFNGKKHGYGTMTWFDGRVEEGYWTNDQQGGKGRHYSMENYGGMDFSVLNIFCSVKQVINDQSRLPFIDEVMVQRFVVLLLS